MWWTLVIGAEQVVGKDRGWTPHYFARKSAKAIPTVKQRFITRAKSLQRKLSIHGFAHVEVRVSHHATAGFPAHGKMYTITDFEHAPA